MEDMVLTNQIVMKADVVNNVGYSYSREAIQSMHEQLQKKIDERQAFGEILHNGPKNVIDLSKVTHIATRSEIDGDEWKVDIRFLDIPNGLLLKDIIEKAPKGTIRFRPSVRVAAFDITSDKVIKDCDVFSIGAINVQDDSFGGQF